MKFSEFSNEILQYTMNWLDAKTMRSVKLLSKQMKTNADAVDMQWLKAKLNRVKTSIIPLLNIPLYEGYLQSFSTFEAKINAAEDKEANKFHQELNLMLQHIFWRAAWDFTFQGGSDDRWQLKGAIAEEIIRFVDIIKAIVAYGVKLDNKDIQKQLSNIILPKLAEKNEVRKIIKNLGIDIKEKPIVDKLFFSENKSSSNCIIM